MMRVIGKINSSYSINDIHFFWFLANPLYDKLTISRAAHIQKYNPVEYACKSIRLKRQKEKTIITSVKLFNSEETIVSRKKQSFASLIDVD